MLPTLLVATLALAQEPAPTPAPGTGTSAPPVTTPTEAPPAPPTPADAAASPPTILFPVRAANLGAAEVRAVEVLFRRRYESATGRTPLEEEKVRAAMRGTDDQGLYATCVDLGCASWITVDLVRLDQEIYVTVLERDATATVVRRIETVAPNLDALSGLMDRITVALASGVSLAKVPAAAPPPASTASTTPTSAAPPTRTKRFDSQPGFKLGVHGPLWPNFGLSISNAFAWRLEQKTSFIEFVLGLTLPLSISNDRAFGMGYLEAGYSYIFPTSGGLAFYAGGGFGPRMGGYDDFGVGVSVYAQAGLMFGRKTTSRTYLQAKLGGDGFTSLWEPYVVSYAGLEMGVGF